MIETYPLDKVAEAYAEMLTGDAQFSVVFDDVTITPVQTMVFPTGTSNWT